LGVANKYVGSVLVTHQRQEDLAGDTVTTSQVLKSLLGELELKGESYEQCCLLLPTCPFRSVDDIRKAKKMLTEDVDSVISMKTSPTVPDFIFRENPGSIAKPFVEHSQVINGKTRSQDYPDMYYPNGAVYYAWTKTFCNSSSFYSNNFKILKMPEYRSVDIDIEEDLIYAHAIYERFLNDSNL